MAHHPKAFTIGRLAWIHSHAVIANGKHCIRTVGEANPDSLCPRMLHSIMHCFASDAVEVRGREAVGLRQSGRVLERARDVVGLSRTFRQLVERYTQPL